jgi:hypothetical protein
MKPLPLNQLEDLIRAEVPKGDLSLIPSLSNFCALLAFSCGFYYSTLIILAILFFFICFVCNF